MRERPIASLASIPAARSADLREYLSTRDISSPDHALDSVLHAHGGWFSFQGGCSREAFHAACLAFAFAAASAPLGPCVLGEASAPHGLDIISASSAARRAYLSILDVVSPAQALDTVFHVYDGRWGPQRTQGAPPAPLHSLCALVSRAMPSPPPSRGSSARPSQSATQARRARAE